MIYSRVKGEETWKQGRDRHEARDERGRKEGGNRGEPCAIGGNEEEDFLRGQVKHEGRGEV